MSDNILAIFPSATQMNQLDRQSRAHLRSRMAKLIWQQYCLEQDIPYEGFDRAPADFQLALLEGVEAFANMALDPDCRDAALMAMADAICRSTYHGDLTISEVSRPTQMSFLTTAEAALRSFLLNLMSNPQDAHYRDSMSRLMDALVPKKGVM